MAKYRPSTEEIDMEGMDPETEWGASMWIHENVHKTQHATHGWTYSIKYRINNWTFERPAYYAQLCFLLQSEVSQSRFAWLRDILDMGYSGVKPSDVEELLDELQITS